MEYKNFQLTQLYHEINLKKIENRDVELILRVKNDDVIDCLENFALITRRFSLIPYVSVCLPAEDAQVLASEFYSGSIKHNDFKGVSSVELSNKITLPTPNFVRVGKFSKYWHLDALNVSSAQKYSTARGVKVGVIDTGCEFSHPEISDCFSGVLGYNFVQNNSDPIDDNGHGTHVSGLIAGSNCGVAIDSTLFGLKVLDSNGSGSESNAMAAIEWAVLNKLDIVNMSFGSIYHSNAYLKMVEIAAAKGLIMVAAAGNAGSYSPSYPASFDGVISVAAVDENLKHASFSNVYPTNDISAPGVNVVSSFLGSSYARLDGTSMASPLVTGSLALVAKESDLERLLKDSAQSLNNNDSQFSDYEIFGAGLVRPDIMVSGLNKRKILLLVKKVVW